MHIKKGQGKILFVFSLFLVVYTVYFALARNYEFLFYIAIIISILLLILHTNKKVNYPNSVLWGMTLWGIMHISGGGLKIGGTRLYDIILIPVSESYQIFRYDQLVHIIGFGVATILMFYLLKPLLKPNLKKWSALSIIIVMAGLGVGALNEIVEFAATAIVPKTGVGGYINTSLDLVADLMGALLALIYIRYKERK